MNTKFGILIAALVTNSIASSQTPNPPFNIVGQIEDFTLDPDCLGSSPQSPLCGASVIVNGIKVTIPRNTIIVMPATYLTPHDIFQGPHPKAGGTLQMAGGKPVSGLALRDPVPFKVIAPFEASVRGNIVGAQYIAGLVNISQQPLNATQGFITAINYTNGELTVGQPGGPTTIVRLNDPALGQNSPGRFGRAESFDERFTADQANPTIRSETGYPMCIPSVAPPAVDGRCPASNRPADPIKRWTIGSEDAMAGLAAPAAPACAFCNVNKLVPFRIGDYITFSGTLVRKNENPASPDYNKVGYVSAHTVIASLGIYTRPNTGPAYVAFDVTIVATGGVPFPGISTELGPHARPLPPPVSLPSTRLRIEGVTTDPRRAVDIFAVDYDPSGDGTGTIGERPALASIGPAGKPPFGRFRAVIDTSSFLPPPHELRVRVSGFTPVASNPAIANGFSVGEYTAPVQEYLFPETNVFGQPPAPLNFENLCFLFAGTGRLTTLGRTGGPMVGQLSPWPNSGNMAPQVACPASFGQ